MQVAQPRERNTVSRDIRYRLFASLNLSYGSTVVCRIRLLGILHCLRKIFHHWLARWDVDIFTRCQLSLHQNSDLSSSASIWTRWRNVGLNPAPVARRPDGSQEFRSSLQRNTSFLTETNFFNGRFGNHHYQIYFLVCVYRPRTGDLIVIAIYWLNFGSWLCEFCRERYHASRRRSRLFVQWMVFHLWIVHNSKVRSITEIIRFSKQPPTGQVLKWSKIFPCNLWRL